MLADASIYAIALVAAGDASRQRRSARLSGWLQLTLAALVLVEVIRRALSGSEPVEALMVVIGLVALAANLACVAILSRHRRGGAHMRANWIFTTNDALANVGVIIAGVLVAVTGSALPDLVIGTAIAALVASGAWRILRMVLSTGFTSVGGSGPMELIRPQAEHLPSYLDALRRGWSPNTEACGDRPGGDRSGDRRSGSVPRPS